MLFLSALCANRSFSSSTCRFAVQAQCFGRLARSRCRASRICDPGVFTLTRPAWLARDTVCAGAVFVGPVVQSARFGKPETCQNWSKSFWRHSPVLVLDACRKRVKVGFRGKSSTLDDFDFVASLLCVTGAALSSFSCKLRGRRSAWCLGVDFVASASL